MGDGMDAAPCHPARSVLHPFYPTQRQPERERERERRTHGQTDILGGHQVCLKSRAAARTRVSSTHSEMFERGGRGATCLLGKVVQRRVSVFD